jgi:hypothetical protein
VTVVRTRRQMAAHDGTAERAGSTGTGLPRARERVSDGPSQGHADGRDGRAMMPMLLRRSLDSALFKWPCHRGRHAGDAIGATSAMCIPLELSPFPDAFRSGDPYTPTARPRSDVQAAPHGRPVRNVIIALIAAGGALVATFPGEDKSPIRWRRRLMRLLAPLARRRARPAHSIPHLRVSVRAGRRATVAPVSQPISA